MHFSRSHLLSCLLFGAAAAYGNDTSSTCNALASALPGDIFFPDTPTYNGTVSSYPFIQLRLHPTCVLRPKSAQDVSTALKVLKDNDCTKFAVKGGGHNANVGFANIEDGVTIDMQSMKSVDVDVKGQVARAGAGALAQDVYDVVEPHNLTVMGPRIGVVGIAGFLTGGGVNFFSPELGWSCDYVVNFEVVLASGEIVNANATSNTDLFAALKGGQSNFGIVTRFDLKAFPVGPIWGGRMAFAPTADTDLIQAFTDFKNPVNFDPHAAGWVTIRYNGTSKAFMPTAITWYTKADQAPGALKNITSIKPQVFNGLTTAYPGEFARNASMVVKTANQRTIWATTTFRMTPTIAHKIHQKWKSLIPDISTKYANATSELTLQSLAPPPRNGAPPNSLGFAPDSTPEKDFVFLQIIFYFVDESVQDGLYKELENFTKIFNDLAEEEGVREDWEYLNFSAYFQNPLQRYGQDVFKQLRQVSRKYDPQGIFQRQLSGGFKVFA